MKQANILAAPAVKLIQNIIQDLTLIYEYFYLKICKQYQIRISNRAENFSLSVQSSK